MLTKHLGGMVAIPQFFLWRLQWNAAANKYKKSPCALDGAVYAIDASDRANWCDYATAQTALGRLTASPRADGLAYAVGFWLTADCPYWRSEEHTSGLQSLMRISYAVYCLRKKNRLNMRQ